MSILVSQVATFTGDVFGGNPAFVLTFEGQVPDEALLQRICRQLAQPIIAVIEHSGSALRLRTITPTGSHPGAGHTTHAAAWVAFNRLLSNTTELVFELESGATRSARRGDDLVTVDWPAMPFSESDRRDQLAECLGRRPEQTYDAAFGAVAVFANEDDIATLSPDLAKVASLDCGTVIVTASGRSVDFVLRVFAPKQNLPEDPVCGTAHRILAPLWARGSGHTKLVSHQLSERHGELFCELRGDTVAISGRATAVLDGSLAFNVEQSR